MIHTVPGNSAGKESTCKAGDHGLIPWSGRSAGEEMSYPLQYSWAFLVAQLVKNLPANAADIRDVGSIPGLGRSPGDTDLQARFRKGRETRDQLPTSTGS